MAGAHGPTGQHAREAATVALHSKYADAIQHIAVANRFDIESVICRYVTNEQIFTAFCHSRFSVFVSIYHIIATTIKWEIYFVNKQLENIALIRFAAIRFPMKFRFG